MNIVRESSFRSEVCSVIAERHLLKHPFYVAWSQGELSREDMRFYAAQYLHYVLSEPIFLSAVHANTPHFASDGKIDLGPRQAILQNLVDEELGSSNHPELWKRFAVALGLTQADLETTDPLPATRALLEVFTGITRDEPYYCGLAALHAFESQVPDIAHVKIDGLRRFYGITAPRDYEFFTVHKTADVAHCAAEWQLIEKAADSVSRQSEAVGATRRAADALWRFLDGVYSA